MVNCRLCNGGNLRQAFVKDAIPYWDCLDCEFRFSSPETNPNLRDNVNEYEEAYLQYLSPAPSDDVNFATLLSWVCSLAPVQGADLLDVGTGSGKWVRYLNQHGVNARGVEPAGPLYDQFLKGDEHFIHGDAASVLAQTNQPFDVVTAFDVLEHVEDPGRFLAELAELTKGGGVVFLSTPNVDSVLARLMRKRWHFNVPYHLSYFSRKTLYRYMGQLGLEPIGFRYVARYQSLGYLTRYVWNFVLEQEGSPGLASRLDSIHLPINTFDNMHVAFRRGLS